MPDCDLEHERDFGEDKAGYRCGARCVHGAGAMLCNCDARKGRGKDEYGYNLR